MVSKKRDYVRTRYEPLLAKSLHSALAHRIGQEFPKMGGKRIRSLCADMVLEVVQEHLRPKEHLRHGQLLWAAISVDDPPSRGKSIADTDLVPVVLDLHDDNDVKRLINRDGPLERIVQKAARMCFQAYEQGGLLSNSDLAEILNRSDSRIADALVAYERRTKKVIPRRATIHDMGSGMTHKAIICRLRLMNGWPSEKIARETHHSIDAVDAYLGQYNRVCCCQQQGMTPEETAFTLNCSVSLVKEYLSLIEEIEGKKGGCNK